MNKIICKRVFIFVFTLSIIFTGCSVDMKEQNDSLKLKPVVNFISDSYYLVFPNEIIEKINFTSELATINLNSLKELKSILINKNFTDEQISIMNKSFAKDDHGIKICDYNKLFHPILPEGYKTNGLIWSGTSYTFVLDSSKETSGMFYYLTKEKYKEKYKKNYEDFLSSSNIKNLIEKDEESDGVKVKSYYHDTSVGSFKFIRYTLEREGRKYIIEERYRLKTINKDMSISETIPYTIKMYCEIDGIYFAVSLHDFETKPSQEFLTSFSIKEYLD